MEKRKEDTKNAYKGGKYEEVEKEVQNVETEEIFKEEEQSKPGRQ